MLRRVSRSFYLTLRMLPRVIRPQIGLAYLLARATDTIADTRLVPVERRLAALDRLREALRAASEGDAHPLPDLGELSSARSAVPGRGSDAERVLLASVGQALDVLRGLPVADRAQVGRVLEIITSGQELDLKRFGLASMKRIVSLETDEELDDYIYRVAGSVGEFWTTMCRGHLFPRVNLNDHILMERGVRFGKGLQLVNVLRDIPEDLREGRCYIPKARLAESGLIPPDLLNRETISRFRPLYNEYLDQAVEYLAAGWVYTDTLPRTQARLRLGCSWPILIGLETIFLLRRENVLDTSSRIKISRAKMRRLILRSFLYYPFPNLWSRLPRK